MRTRLFTLALAIVIGVTVAAPAAQNPPAAAPTPPTGNLLGQKPTPPPPATPPQQPGRAGQKPTPPPSAPPSTPPPSANQPPRPLPLKNIRLDVTISDSVGTGGPAKKTLTLLLMNGRNGQIRSSGTVRGVINVDARASEHTDGRIELYLTLEYAPEAVSQEAGGPVGLLNQSLTVLLENGAPTLITQSADPRNDRRVTVEVTATTVK